MLSEDDGRRTCKDDRKSREVTAGLFPLSLSCYGTAITASNAKKRVWKGVDGMEVVLAISGIIGFGLLMYLFYVLFRGENL